MENEPKQDYESGQNFTQVDASVSSQFASLKKINNVKFKEEFKV